MLQWLDNWTYLGVCIGLGPAMLFIIGVKPLKGISDATMSTVNRLLDIANPANKILSWRWMFALASIYIVLVGALVGIAFITMYWSPDHALLAEGHLLGYIAGVTILIIAISAIITYGLAWISLSLSAALLLIGTWLHLARMVLDRSGKVAISLTITTASVLYASLIRQDSSLIIAWLLGLASVPLLLILQKKYCKALPRKPDHEWSAWRHITKSVYYTTIIFANTTFFLLFFLISYVAYAMVMFNVAWHHNEKVTWGRACPADTAEMLNGIHINSATFSMLHQSMITLREHVLPLRSGLINPEAQAGICIAIATSADVLNKKEYAFWQSFRLILRDMRTNDIIREFEMTSNPFVNGHAVLNFIIEDGFSENELDRDMYAQLSSVTNVMHGAKKVGTGYHYFLKTKIRVESGETQFLFQAAAPEPMNYQVVEFLEEYKDSPPSTEELVGFSSPGFLHDSAKHSFEWGFWR